MKQTQRIANQRPVQTMTPDKTDSPTVPEVNGSSARDMNKKPDIPNAQKAIAIAAVIFLVAISSFACGFALASPGSDDLFGALLRFALINAAAITPAVAISVWMMGRMDSNVMHKNDSTGDSDPKEAP